MRIELLPLFEKELRVKFRSSLPLWGMGFLQVGMASWLFWIYDFFRQGLADLDPLFRMLTTVFTLLLPLYAAGDITGERKSGNWDLFSSFPIGSFQILLAKLLANTVWLLLHLLQIGTVLVPLLSFGEFDAGAVKTSLFGLGIYGVFTLALGQWMSLYGKNTLLAYLFTLGILISLLLLPFWAGRLPLPEYLLGPVRYLSIPHHLDGFFRGTILLKDLGFFLGGVAICLILARGGLAAT
jgi:ABC-type transport system involved in multi-copper enzyme maturation permease subunit